MLESVARQYRAAIETAVQSLNDETAVKVKTLYPTWESLIGKTLTAGVPVYNSLSDLVGLYVSVVS